MNENNDDYHEFMHSDEGHAMQALVAKALELYEKELREDPECGKRLVELYVHNKMSELL